MRGHRRARPGLADRPREGLWPCLRLDATCLEVRRNGRVVPVAVAGAIAANEDGLREIVGVFPNAAAIVRAVGAVLAERNDESTASVPDVLNEVSHSKP